MIQQYSASMLLCLLQASLTRAFKVPAHARCMRLCRPAALCVPCSAARQLLAWASDASAEFLYSMQAVVKYSGCVSSCRRLRTNSEGRVCAHVMQLKWKRRNSHVAASAPTKPA